MPDRINGRLIAVAAALALLLAACGASDRPVAAVELTVSAAASLTDALQEIQRNYEHDNTHTSLSFNFAASGALQRQIEQGAPVDLFLSASTRNMQALVEQGLVDAERQTALLRNELVVIVPAGGGVRIDTLADLAQAVVRTVAIGIPESVPAGQYAQEALVGAGLWEALQPKTVQGKDVRQVLQYVESGNADAGFVYKTDALAARQAAIAFAVDPAAYSAVEYPVGIVRSTKHDEEAERFYRYLQSREALDVFVQYGFSAAQPTQPTQPTQSPQPRQP